MATGRSNLHIYLLNNCTLDHYNHIEGCRAGEYAVAVFFAAAATADVLML